MDKPARLAVAAVQTRAEQPEAPPFLVLDSVIVADRFYSAEALGSPPFVGDPLRPIGPRDPMPASPPRETKRRIIGQKPKSFDRLRRLEQSDRPRRFVRGLRNGSAGVDATDRHPDRGALRDVALARFEPRQRGEPQSVAEPIEKRSDAARLIAGGVAGEADLLGGQGLDRKGGEDHVFDTETRINSVEPLFEEGYQVARIAARTSGAEADPLDPAVDTMKGEIETPRSRPFPRQAGNEIRDEPLGCAQQIGGIGNRLGEAQPHAPGRRFAQWRQRLRQIIECLIEAPRHALAKAARERSARHRIEIANPLQADSP